MSGVVSTDFVGVGVAGAATPPVPLELAGTAASSIAVSCAHTIARSAVSSSPTVGDELARRFATNAARPTTSRGVQTDAQQKPETRVSVC